mmetsp:Transcript_42521/g.102258  ORF Transcript_42521/g.102258 Transcript_42521/m.102258 type:complete len:207 (+) Transcript_42521:81-701(+)
MSEVSISPRTEPGRRSAWPPPCPPPRKEEVCCRVTPLAFASRSAACWRSITAKHVARSCAVSRRNASTCSERPSVLAPPASRCVLVPIMLSIMLRPRCWSVPPPPPSAPLVRPSCSSHGCWSICSIVRRSDASLRIRASTSCFACAEALQPAQSGASVRMRCRSVAASMCPSSNGWKPTSRMYSTTPSAHRSIGSPGPEAGACGWS